MPEYLAPGVYVEEIDTGSKPIEGVSTSTAGMVGVAERGPVNVPILITGLDEYRRWFGGNLRLEDFSNDLGAHCYLPHAIEGFFTNRGKRVYVVRVLKTDSAELARTQLFDRGASNSALTRLLAPSATGSSSVYVVSNTGIATNEWLRIGEGSQAEYLQVNALPGNPNHATLHLPLSLAHTAGALVDHLNAPGTGAEPATTLAQAAEPGDTSITVANATGFADGDLIIIGTAASGDDEYIQIGVPNTTANTLPLRTPVLLHHAATTTGVQGTDGGTAIGADATTLAAGRPAAVGDAVVFLTTPAPYGTLGDFIRIRTGSQTTDPFEVRRIGDLASVALRVPAYDDYPPGATIERLNVTDDSTVTAKALQVDASAGNTALRLNNRVGLEAGDLLRIGLAADPTAEYATVIQAPNRQTGAPDAGVVVLSAALQNSHPAGTEVRVQAIAEPIQAGATQSAFTQQGEATLFLSRGTNFNSGNVVRVRSGDAVYFHTLAANPVALNAEPVTLGNPFEQPHLSGSAVAERAPLFDVFALDPGRWGDRLRVSIQDQEPPLLRTQIREVQDLRHIRLVSATGVEPGTILQVMGADGAGTGEPFKVINVDRNNNYLLTLAADLPTGAIVNAPVRTREFQLGVYLMRPPDPAVPSRSEQVMATESFRFLSLDPRHSRYIHNVIGTTWDWVTVGTTDDDDGNPLRLEDRRSEGESAFIRVRDLAQALGEPNRTTMLESIRLGPEAMLDMLPDGRTRPARHRLRFGNDAVGSIDFDTYIGQDHIEPMFRTGLQCLRSEDEISIVAIPGRTSATEQNALIAHCELMRYRFAVLDAPPPPTDSLADVQNLRQQYDTKYAAMYHPWLVIPHPFPINPANIPNYPIPPSGHMMGIYARTDIDRGVHKAPANEVVLGIIGLQRILRKEQQDILNPSPVNINVIRDFRLENRGLRVYGARVITSDPDWKYVNVRRLLIFIEASIERGLHWVVFEPNAEPLWARVRRSISNFLTVVWRNGALEGVTREEAYFVKCDRTTMTQTDIDNGRLICVIGVAPVKPAEYVIIRIGLWTAHAEE